MLGKGYGGLYNAQQRKKEERERLRGEREREIKSSLLILDLKDGKLSDSGKQEEDKTFHKLHVLVMNDDFLDRVCGLGSETCYVMLVRTHQSTLIGTYGEQE